MINKCLKVRSSFCAIFCLTLICGAITPANAQYVCQPAANPVVITGSLNAGDVQQAGRISRDGVPSSCSGDNAQFENNAVVRRDTHNFSNPYSESVCVTVDMDFSGCAGNQVQSVAYSSFNPANPAVNVIGDSGYSTINKGSYSFTVGPNAGFSVVINEVEPNTGCPLYKLKINYNRNCRQPGFDRTNDGKADITVYRPSSISNWYTIDSVDNSLVGRQFGTVGDIVTGGSDYTGDGQTDLSVYRPTSNSWIYGKDQTVPAQNYNLTQWGTAGDIRVPGDYDQDGKSDIAVFRPSNGTWYVLRSSDGTIQAMKWGQQGDIPISGDFDGDLKTDFAVVRPTGGSQIWYILKSNYNYGFDTTTQWGLAAGDKIVPADYDGDSITDIAVWRASNGTFYIRKSSDLTMLARQWGTNGDIPQPADYDGDKKQDFAVWRPSTGFWYILQSQTETMRAIQWGQQGDQPMAAHYRVQ